MPRERLRQLVVRFGPEIGRDARRCEALLRDVCGAHKKEIFALASAVKEGIPAEIGSPIKGVPPKILFARYAKRLQDNLGISEDLCLWTVESWAYALGVVSKRDLQPETRCPECDTAITVPASLHGKPAKCPKCDTRLLISADGGSLQRRADEAPATASKGAVKETDRQLPQLGVSRSETAEDMFRQIVTRLVAARGQLTPADRPQLDQARLSLGLPFPVAHQIVQQVIHARTPSPPFPNQIADRYSQPPPSNGMWYLRTSDGRQLDPMNDEAIGHWAAGGHISTDTLVWRVGWSAWYPAARVTFPWPAGESPSAKTIATPTFVPLNVKKPPPPTIKYTVPTALAAKANEMANVGMASLFVSLCCCPPLGILFSLIVLAQVGTVQAKLRKCADSKGSIDQVVSGKICAISALIVSFTWFVVYIISLAAQSQSIR